MTQLVKAKEPFDFHTRLNLTELTGLKAANLSQLRRLLKKVPDSSIYHHTHNFLQQYQFLQPEPPSDLVQWVGDTLGEDELGEKLAAIDVVRFTSLADLRQALVSALDAYLKAKPLSKKKFAGSGEEFYFLRSISFILPTQYRVTDLAEFLDGLAKVSLDSIYFHVFEARLRLGRPTNDFSHWLETSLDEKNLADKIARLDPYSYTLEELRNTLIKIIKRKVMA